MSSVSDSELRTFKRSHQKSMFSWSYQLNFGHFEDIKDLPHGLLSAKGRQETFGNEHARSHSGAEGLFQIMPKVAASYRNYLGQPVDPMNPGESRIAAVSEDAKAFKHYRGNLDKALAAYNWGSGNVYKIVHKYHEHWREHLPGETKAYIQHIRADMKLDAAVAPIYRAYREDTGGQNPHYQLSESLHDTLTDNHDITIRVQRRLKELGYDVGKLDGKDGKKLHHALKQFEQQMVDSGVILSDERFKNDGNLDFSSLNTMLCRVPGIYDRLTYHPPHPHDRAQSRGKG